MKLLFRTVSLFLLMFFVSTYSQQKKIVLQERCAVIVYPSDEKLKALRKESASEDEYFAMVEDGLFYTSEAKLFLNKKKIKLIKISSSDVLQYKDKGAVKNFLVKSLSWDIVFYMPKKHPKRIDITNVEDEFQKYFLTIKSKKL